MSVFWVLKNEFIWYLHFEAYVTSHFYLNSASRLIRFLVLTFKPAGILNRYLWEKADSVWKLNYGLSLPCHIISHWTTFFTSVANLKLHMRSCWKHPTTRTGAECAGKVRELIVIHSHTNHDYNTNHAHCPTHPPPPIISALAPMHQHRCIGTY